MKTIRKALGAGAVAVLLAACGGSPTGAAEPSDASFDEGGFGMGSGSRAAPADSTGGAGTSSSDTAERGGFTMGSGG
jgi:ABC-type glycerol-3-phosphate transport system substrate-binding protein